MRLLILPVSTAALVMSLPLVTWGAQRKPAGSSAVAPEGASSFARPARPETAQEATEGAAGSVKVRETGEAGVSTIDLGNQPASTAPEIPVTALPSDQAPTFTSPVWPIVMGALSLAGIIAIGFILFGQQRKLTDISASLTDLRSRLHDADAERRRAPPLRVPMHVASSEATDGIPPAPRRFDDRTEREVTLTSPQDRSEPSYDGELPKTWQTPTIPALADWLTDSSRQTEPPLNAYCGGSITLEALTAQATRQGKGWGSFVIRDGRFEFKEGTTVNKLIGFRMPEPNEFSLVLGEGTMWDLDFLQFFEVRDGREPRLGDQVFATEPALARFVNGTPIDVTKGVMRLA